MNKGILNWLERINYENLKSAIGLKREVFIWGAYADGKYVREILCEHGISVQGYIDNYKDDTNYDELPLSIFNETYNPKKSFIIIAVVGKRKGIIDLLTKYGFKNGLDYRYISEETPNITISKCTGVYEDKYGNIVQIETDDLHADIEIKGYENHIHIGKSVNLGKNVHFLIENGSKISIGENMNIEDNVSIEAINAGTITIGNGGRICQNGRICSKGGDIIIGNGTSTGRNFLCLSGSHSFAKIGNDCMFSADTSVLGTNSHSIFNMETKENLSLREKGVFIGNHVWLGKSATVLCNSEIADGCIVGANSIVKINSPSNCLLVGNPAKISATKRMWDRRREVLFEDL